MKHSSKSNEWYTPIWLIDMVREVLGPIDFDPASCEEANKIVEAKYYYTEEALTKLWPYGSIYCNPPGGKVKNKSQATLFWEKLTNSTFSHAIFMGFNISLLRTTQQCTIPMTDFPICIPRERIHFIGAGDSPQYDNIIAYVPYKIDRTEKFQEVFSKIGVVINV